jgi:hypothetical protein|tara:strand:+ start:146 stop:673 length:528 start_codon:yes stop_codon:yes gene_type:complete
MPLSLYIPRVFSQITKEEIIEIFNNLEIGQVSNIDFVPREDKNTGQAYNIAFIHFSKYYDNIISKNFQNKVKSQEEQAKIVYDDPNYWICLPNLNPKTDAMRELENRVDALEQLVELLLMDKTSRGVSLNKIREKDDMYASNNINIVSNTEYPSAAHSIEEIDIRSLPVPELQRS